MSADRTPSASKQPTVPQEQVGTLLRHAHMAKMPGDSLSSMKKLAVDHRAAADACADCQIDDVADTAPRAIAPFAKRCGDPVILDPCGKSGSF